MLVLLSNIYLYALCDRLTFPYGLFSIITLLIMQRSITTAASMWRGKNPPTKRNFPFINSFASDHDCPTFFGHSASPADAR